MYLFLLLSNIDQENSLCNEIRLQVNDMAKNVTFATIIMGKKNIGEKIFIPRMNLIPFDSGFPFQNSKEENF